MIFPTRTQLLVLRYMDSLNQYPILYIQIPDSGLFKRMKPLMLIEKIVAEKNDGIRCLSGSCLSDKRFESLREIEEKNSHGADSQKLTEERYLKKNIKLT